MNDTSPLMNIGPKGRRQRGMMAAAMGIALVAGMAVIVLTGAPKAARLLLAIPLFVASLGLFQAADGT